MSPFRYSQLRHSPWDNTLLDPFLFLFLFRFGKRQHWRNEHCDWSSIVMCVAKFTRQRKGWKRTRKRYTEEQKDTGATNATKRFRVKARSSVIFVKFT